MLYCSPRATINLYQNRNDIFLQDVLNLVSADSVDKVSILFVAVFCLNILYGKFYKTICALICLCVSMHFLLNSESL